MAATSTTMNTKLETAMDRITELNAEVARLRKQSANTRTVSFKTEEGAEEPAPGNQTTANNSQGLPCAIKKQKSGPMQGKWFFVNPQYCKTCKKEAHHLPRYCPEKRENNKRKLEAMD